MRTVQAPRLGSSLRARMTGGFTLAFAVFVALACGSFLFGLRQTAVHEARVKARDAAALTASEWTEDSSLSLAFDDVREQMRFADVSLRVIDRGGRTVATSRRIASPWPPHTGDGWLTETATHGADRIVAGVYWRPIEMKLEAEGLLLAALCVPIIGTAALLAWTLVGRTLRPIGALADQAGSVTDNLLLVQLADPSPDAEVRRLVATLNGLLTRLRRSADTREQFYAAAAHELRTPLSVLAGSIELALTRPRTADEYVETLTDLQGETKRLVVLAEGLLTLNRLQTQGSETPTRVDVAEQCANALAAFAPLASARDLRVETEWPETGVTLFAPASHVAMLTRNLIENAVKYATPGGAVRVSVQPAAEGLVLRVFNDYPNAEQLPLDRLFEAFYRADASRSSETGGNGLGLAICRQLADANHWALTITATSGGIIVTVTFPSG